MTKSSPLVARLATSFVLHAHFELTARETKMILFLISKLDPEQEAKLREIFLFEEELESILKTEGKLNYSLADLAQWNRQLLNRLIEFPSDSTINGQPVPGITNWFQHILSLIHI